MKHRVICAASIALFASLAFLSGCSGDGGSAVATDADAATDPASSQGTGTGTSAGSDNGASGPTGGSLGNGGSGSIDSTGSQGSTTDDDGGVTADGSAAYDGGHDAATGTKADAGQGPGQTARAFGEACSRDTQCASGACTRNGGGGNAGYCSIQCTTANQAVVCVKPLTSGQCVRGFCAKP